MNVTQLETFCQGLDYKIIQDQVLMANASIGAHHYGINLQECTPTFILKVDDLYVAMIIQGNKRLDFKKIKQLLNAKNVTMATKEEIFALTHSTIGSVSMINPELKTLIDVGVQDLDYCYGGCGTEKYTLKIKASDLLKVTQATIGEFTTEKSDQGNKVKELDQI